MLPNQGIKVWDFWYFY